MQQDDYVIKQIQKGIDAENLIKHSTWKLVINKLQEEMMNAMMQLSTTVNPDDTVKIKELQNIIFRYTGLVTRVDEIIQEANFLKGEIELNE
jgi:hypothetical protein